MDSISNNQEQVEAIDDLLEDFWFFGNLLNRKSRILRYCHSDPYPFSPPSSSSTRGDSVPPTCTEKKEGVGERKKINKMRRQFSEKIRVQESSTYLQKKEHVVREKGNKEGYRRNRTGNYMRNQTFPSYTANEFQDQESDDPRMGFLIREAIASSSKQNTPKVSNIPRPRPPRNSRSKETMQELVVDTKEILMLKDLDIGSEKKQEEEKQTMVPRTAVKMKSQSAVLVGQPIPVWVPKDSKRETKAQIKFWARTVASNVRQEC